MLKKDNKIINVKIVNKSEKQKIINYLNQVISNWIKEYHNKWFTLKTLLDFDIGQHYDWRKTDLQVLYENYIKAGKTEEEAFSLGGKAAGKLLKETVHKRQKNFDTKKEYLRKYKLV